MLIAELGLAPATKRALRAAGISTTDQLKRPANELLAAEQITGAAVYDVACRLQEHGLGLRHGALPSEGDLEILRLRVVEGLSLRDIGIICSISPDRVRQRLHLRFGLSGDPPAVLERRLHRGRPRPDWERIIALRLHRAESGLAMAVLLRGFADAPFGNEARTAVGRMQAKGLVTVRDNQVIPTPALRSMTDARSFSLGAHRGTARCGGGR